MFKDNDNNVVRLLDAFEGEVYDNLSSPGK